MDRASPPTFQLRLLGRFDLTGPSGPIDLTSKKLAGLLAVLGCSSSKPHNRDELMTLLWGSHFQAQARQNLRQAFTRLRRVLGEDAFTSNGEMVSLRPGALECDVVRFEALIADGGRDALNEAVGLYRGRFLADITIHEEAWAEWLDPLRQRLEGLALDAMVKLGDQELRLGNHQHALRAGKLAEGVSKLREDVHRLVIRTLAAAGRRADALQHYQDLVKLLKDELSIEPDDLTKQLIAEVRSTGPSHSVALKANPTVSPPPLPAVSSGTIVAINISRGPGVGSVLDVIRSVAARHGAILSDGPGGEPSIEFSQARSATRAALDLQRELSAGGAAASGDVRWRMGAHSFSCEEERDAAREAAWRLAIQAAPGQVIASNEVCDQLTDGLDAYLEDLGEVGGNGLGNIRCYRVRPQPSVARAKQAPAEQLRPMLAVIPFDARHAGHDDDVIGEVLADDIIGALSRCPELGVISHLSSRAFRGRRLGLHQICSQLLVNYVLSGDYSVQGERLRARAELAEAESGTVLWSRELQGTTGEMTGGSGEMLDQIVAETSASIMVHELARAEGKPLPTLDSYVLLMAAINLISRTSPSGFVRAREMLRELNSRVPHHPMPHAWMAAWHIVRLSQGWTSDPAAEAQTALDCCKRALDADPHCSLALAMDGHAHEHFSKRFDIAASRFELAIEVNPNESIAWLYKGTSHGFKGEGELAVNATERALRLSPLDPRRSYYDALAAGAALSAGRYERAIELAQRSLRINSLHTSALRALALAQSLSGRVDSARETVAALLRLEPTLTVSRYLKRNPVGEFATGKLYGEALRAAGLPE